MNLAIRGIDAPNGGSFADMVAVKHSKDICGKMNKIIRRLAEANDLKGDVCAARSRLR